MPPAPARANPARRSRATPGASGAAGAGGFSLNSLGGNAMLRLVLVVVVLLLWSISIYYVYGGGAASADGLSDSSDVGDAARGRSRLGAAGARPTRKTVAGGLTRRTPAPAVGRDAVGAVEGEDGVALGDGDELDDKRRKGGGATGSTTAPARKTDVGGGLVSAGGKGGAVGGGAGGGGGKAANLPYLIDFTIKHAASPTFLKVDFDQLRKEYVLVADEKPLDLNRKFTWDLTPEGEIRNVNHVDQCLTMLSDASTAYATPCVYKMSSQKWYIDTDGLIHNQRRADLCVAYTDHLFMTACTADRAEVQWSIAPSRDAMLAIILRLGLEPVDRIRDASAFEEALKTLLEAPAMERVEIILLKLSMESDDPIVMLANQYRENFQRKQMNVRVLPSLLTGVSASMHINNAVNNGARFITVIDHVSEIFAAGPHFYSNAIQVLFEKSVTRNIAIPAAVSKDPIFSQGCRCLRKAGIPDHDLYDIMPALGAAAPPVVPRSIWTRSGGLHYIPMGSRSRRDCQMTDFWMTADATVGLMPAYIDGAQPSSGELTRAQVQQGYEQCPGEPFDKADENSGVIASTVDEPFIKSWLMLRNVEMFTQEELMYEQCRLVLTPSGFLHSEEFEAYKRKYLSVDAHVLFMEGIRQEGSNSLMSARTSFNFLVFGSRLDGTRRISIWPYLYRHYIIARSQPLIFANMEDCVSPVSFNPADAVGGGLSVKPITKEEAVAHAQKIDAAVDQTERPVFHFVITFKDPEQQRFPYLSIESVFFHHPTAIVFVHSDIVTDAEIASFVSRQLDIAIVPLAVLRHESNSFWYPMLLQHIEQLFGKEKLWFYEMADLYKYWILDRFGGIALDFDVVLVKPLVGFKNTIGLEAGTISPSALGEDFSINGNVMIFEKGNPFIREVMLNVPRRFKMDQVVSIGSKLLTHVFRRQNNVRVEGATIKADGVTVVGRELFNPISGVKTNLKLFHMSLINEKAWEQFVSSPAIAVHFFTRAAGTTETMTNSLADRILTAYCNECELPVAS